MNVILKIVRNGTAYRFDAVFLRVEPPPRKATPATNQGEPGGKDKGGTWEDGQPHLRESLHRFSGSPGRFFCCSISAFIPFIMPQNGESVKAEKRS